MNLQELARETADDFLGKIDTTLIPYKRAKEERRKTRLRSIILQALTTVRNECRIETLEEAANRVGQHGLLDLSPTSTALRRLRRDIVKVLRKMKDTK